MVKNNSYELLNIENGQIYVEQTIIDKIAMLQVMQKQLEELNDKLRLEMLYAMKECGVKKYENDVFSVTYVAPKMQRRVDTEKLKADGLYDQYSYELETVDSVRIKMKEK